MDVATIQVERRSAAGSKQVRRLREGGKVPAILYGQGKGTVSLEVRERDLARHVRQHHKVFKLAMEGKEQAIFLQEIQWDCLTDRPLHCDFVRIDLEKPMHVNVELKFLGHPAGVSKGGRLVYDLMEIPVTCLPASIPEVIELQVGHIDLDVKFLASELELPAGVTLDVPPDTVVCHMPGEVDLGEEPEEAGEGEEAPPETPGEG